MESVVVSGPSCDDSDDAGSALSVLAINAPHDAGSDELDRVSDGDDTRRRVQLLTCARMILGSAERVCARCSRRNCKHDRRRRLRLFGKANQFVQVLLHRCHLVLPRTQPLYLPLQCNIRHLNLQNARQQLGPPRLQRRQLCSISRLAPTVSALSPQKVRPASPASSCALGSAPW